MKAKCLPFLYFFSLLFLFDGSSATFAQSKKDSSAYYYGLLINPKQASDLTDAYLFFERNLQDNLKQKDTIAAIADLRFMANIQNNLGLFYESEKTIVRALRFLDQNPANDTSDAISGLYNELGMIHRALYNYEKAIDFYEKALIASKTAADSMTVFNNIGFTYSKQGKHDLALIEFEKVYLKSIGKLDKSIIARALNNLGSEQAKQNNPEGVKNMMKAFELRKELNDTKGLYSSHKHLSEYYHDRGKKDSANFYAEEAYKLAKSINSITYIEDALSNMMTIKADSLTLEYKTITDSITKTKQLQENKFAEMQYNYSEYEREAFESQLAASDQRSKTLVYQFVGLTIFLMAIFFYMILKTRHKKENQLKVYETETRISKKVHDEVANDIFKIMTKLQTSHTTNEPLLDDLEDIYIKTRDISKENSDIIHTDFMYQIEDLLRSYQNTDINVITKNLKDIDWTIISDAKKITLYRVLQELMTNMKKHSRASIIALTFKQETKKLHIVYKDNGVGTHLHKGSGCQNMENRMISIKGIITFESEPGAGFKATIIV